MLQTVRTLGPRRLTRLTSIFPIVTTNLVRTGRHASLLSILQPPVRIVSNVKPLILTRIQHARLSTTDTEEEGTVEEKTSPGDKWFGRMIFGCLGCVVLVDQLGHWKERKEVKRWTAVFGVPSYQSWIKTTNLWSCARDQSKEPVFAEEFTRLKFKYTAQVRFNPVKYEASRAQDMIIFRASYAKLVYEAGLCDRCQQSLLDSKDRFAELILMSNEYVGPFSVTIRP